MEKRYQVFISSTYLDLKDERSKVMKSIMDLDCIPAGMEMFPAMDEEQFEFIKKIIDDCDYYILIIGGKYGSMTEGGISYTELEFDYAKSKGIPVLAFLHNNIDIIPSHKVEMETNVRAKLEQFKEKVKKGRLVQFWDSPENLTSQVIISLMQTIKTRPGVGWVRANVATNEESLQELNDLRKEVEQLRAYKSKKEEDTFGYAADIADWDEMFTLHLKVQELPFNSTSTYGITAPKTIKKTWEEWFKLIFTEIQTDDYSIMDSITATIRRVIAYLGAEYSELEPSAQDVLTMGYQFTSYGVVEVRKNYDGDQWTLTSKGKKLYAQMMCVKTKKR